MSDLSAAKEISPSEDILMREMQVVKVLITLCYYLHTYGIIYIILNRGCRQSILGMRR
jgi:hypothetical protein